MIVKTHSLPVKRQAELLAISRSNVYYLPTPTPASDLALMRAIDELHLEYPFWGAAASQDARPGRPSTGRPSAYRHADGQDGITALYRKLNTSKRHPAHKIYPYLLRNLSIERANRVWAMDITYLPMARGFVYLAAVMDRATRRVLTWRVSNTLTADFCGFMNSAQRDRHFVADTSHAKRERRASVASLDCNVGACSTAKFELGATQ